jgi:hypothetical protein
MNCLQEFVKPLVFCNLFLNTFEAVDSLYVSVRCVSTFVLVADLYEAMHLFCTENSLKFRSIYFP